MRTRSMDLPTADHRLAQEMTLTKPNKKSIWGAISKVVTVAMMLSILAVAGPMAAPAEAQVPVATFSINDPSASESAGVMRFVVTRGGNSAEPVIVDYKTVDQTAHSPGDYTHVAGALTFAPGQTTQTVSVPIINDSAVEANNETFWVQILATTPGEPLNRITKSIGVGTIIDNDVPLNIDNAPSVVEGSSGGLRTLLFRVWVATATANDVTFTYSTTGGTATPNADYVPVTNSVLTIPAGETSVMAPVRVIPDTIDEAHEEVIVTLANPVNATIADGTAGGTIVDDDLTPLPVISVSNASALEKDVGGSILTFTVSLSKVSNVTVTLHFTTREQTATAPEDYGTAYGALHFAPGETTKQVNVIAFPDRLDEINETFLLDQLGVVNATFGGPGTGTIFDNDAQPTVRIGDVATTEGTGGTSVMNFPLTLSAPSGKSVSVMYRTQARTAAPGDDYQETTATVTFAPGQTRINAPVPLVPDSIDEFDETVYASILNAGNAQLADGFAVGTIVDDDLAPAFSVNDVQLSEGNVGGRFATFTVTASAPSAKTMTINFATANGTAVANIDYHGKVGSLTFNPGETSKQVVVTVVGDTAVEPNETFFLNVAVVSNARIADGQGQGTILNDD